MCPVLTFKIQPGNEALYIFGVEVPYDDDIDDIINFANWD